MSAPPPPPPELRARVLDAVRRAPAPSRAAALRGRGGAVVLGFVTLLAVYLRLGPHAGTRPAAYIASLAVAWAAVTAALTWIGVARGRSMLGRPGAWKALAVVLAPFALLALWWPLALAWPDTMQNDSGLFEIVQCDVGTFLLAIGPLLAFAYVRRGTDPVSPGLSGAALGVAAAGYGAVALVVVCRHASPTHMVFGHIVPVAFLAALGAAVGSRVLAVRADSG